MATTTTDEYDYLFKFVLVGDSGVGKTNLLSRFSRNTFNIESKSTIGVEFASKSVRSSDDKANLKIQTWDTAGQDRYKALSAAYYRNSSAVILVYDITRRETFEHVTRWLAEIRQHVEESVPVLLVGNKLDLQHLRAVSQADAKALATANSMSYMETSALNASNVDAAFRLLVNEVYERNCPKYLRQDSLLADAIHLPNIKPIILDPIVVKPGKFTTCCAI